MIGLGYNNIGVLIWVSFIILSTWLEHFGRSYLGYLYCSSAWLEEVVTWVTFIKVVLDSNNMGVVT